MPKVEVDIAENEDQSLADGVQDQRPIEWDLSGGLVTRQDRLALGLQQWSPTTGQQVWWLSTGKED